MNKLDQPITHSEVSSQGMQHSNVARDDFGIEIPTEIVPLPSKGVIYPATSALHNKEALEIRPMTAREEDILMSRAYIKKGIVINKLIESCLTDKSINVEELIAGDKTALMVALRITGYGAEYGVEATCNECGASNETQFDLSTLPIKTLQVEPVTNGSNEFEVVLPTTKKSVIVKFLDGYDEKEMNIISERKRKSGIKANSTVTDRLIRSVISVDGVKDKNKIAFFVKNMPVRDSLALRKFLDNQEPGVEMKSYMTCESCYEESEVEVPITTQFFWPDS